MVIFDWDERNLAHIARHMIAPEEAVQVILNRPIDLGVDFRQGEWRQVYLGETDAGRILIVVTAQIEEEIRVVTAWPAKERLRAFWVTQTKGRGYGRETERS